MIVHVGCDRGLTFSFNCNLLLEVWVPDKIQISKIKLDVEAVLLQVLNLLSSKILLHTGMVAVLQ
jgi:hypothetical protein